MNTNVTSQPVILVDIKKHRIRIHKNTLLSIGNPNDILLLVNPEEKTLAIMGCNRSDPRSHHISWTSITNKKSFELYSTALVENLCAICSGWQNNHSYRIYGEIISKEGVVQFHMADSIPVSGISNNI